MRALAVRWPRCVKGKQERVATRLLAHAHEGSRKLSEIGVSVITKQHTDVVHNVGLLVHTELKHVGNGQVFAEFLTLLRLLTKKGIYEGNQKSIDSFFHGR